MIIRHFCARQGRRVLCQSPRSLRAYASESTHDSLFRTKRDNKPAARILGHPEDASSILDASPHAPTAVTRSLEENLLSLDASTKSIEADLNAHISARILSLPNDPVSPNPQDPSSESPGQELDYQGRQVYLKRRTAQKRVSQGGSQMLRDYSPFQMLLDPPRPQDLTLPMLLANQTHLGHHTSLWHPGNSRYIFGIRESIHIISLDVTFAHLRRAAKVVQEIARRGGIILFVGTRKGQTEVVVNAAKLAKAYHVFDRWVPGTLTNGQQILEKCEVEVVDVKDKKISNYSSLLSGTERPVLRPDLVVCLNPLENEVCLHECGLYNVPTIGVVDTDCNPTWVTYPIPANDDSHRSIALIAGCLGRAGEEGQKLRLEVAKSDNKATYSTQGVMKMLENIEEVRGMDVSDALGGASANK